MKKHRTKAVYTYRNGLRSFCCQLSLVFFNNASHSQFAALEILNKCLRAQGKRRYNWLYANALPFLDRTSTDFGAHRDPGTNPVCTKRWMTLCLYFSLRWLRDVHLTSCFSRWAGLTQLSAGLPMPCLRSRMDWHFPRSSCEHISHARHRDKHCVCMWAQEWHVGPNGQAQI